MENASSSSSHTESTLIEEREEVMVSKKSPSLSQTHFLKPFVTSIDDSGSVAELPRRHQRHSVSSSELNRLFSRCSFSGFWSTDRDFVTWLRKIEALHETTWRKAGIYEAIKASTHKITKNPSLLLSVAEKWSPETKSFIFSWGEATVTLEDVNVLLGFSVLGSSVFAPIENSEIQASVEKLERLSREGHVTRASWISSFLGKDDQMEEHEAFLVMWLSFFVFPSRTRRSISKNVIPIAVRLARGERIALAPMVLASIYRDLGRIRDSCDDKVNLKSLLKLVQVWTWERFKNMRPGAKEIPKGEPRISRWGGVKQKVLILNFDDFEWRPYIKPLKNWNPLWFYVEEAMWVTIEESVIDDEFASFARCVRSSPLHGDGFVEDYYPNRVARQFGLAQDLHGLVTHEAWDIYDGLKLYMPSRLAQGSVTVRYRDWWMKSVSVSSEAFDVRDTCDYRDDVDDVAPKMLSLSEVVLRLEKGFPPNLRRPRSMCRSAKNLRFLQLKRAREDDDDDDDNMTIAERMRRFQVGKIASKAQKTRRICDDDNDGSNEPITQSFGSDGTEKVDCSVHEDEEKQRCNEAKMEEDNINDGSNEPIKQSFGSDGTEKADCAVHEDEEKQRSSKPIKDDDNIDERLRKRKMAIEEKAMKLKEGLNTKKKNLAEIRDWITRNLKIRVSV